MKEIGASTAGIGMRVGIVVSRFNNEFGETLLAGALTALRETGVAGDVITVVSVPGVLNVPFALQPLALTE